MDIREYTYVLAIVDCGSISGAAAKLFTLQPSLSIYIKILKSVWSFRCSSRANGPLILTTEGKTYVEYARQIMRLIYELQQHFSSLKQLKTGTVRIGITHQQGGLSCCPLPVPRSSIGNALICCLNLSRIPPIKLEELVTLGANWTIILVNYPFRSYDLDYIELFEERIHHRAFRRLPAVRKVGRAQKHGAIRGGYRPFESRGFPSGEGRR
jgi:DNA-binding transcriptional LysR family regulator